MSESSWACRIITQRMNRLVARCRLLLRRLKLLRARKLVVAVVGGSVVLVGIAMLVLPGPAILVIPLGLAILATEFLWARRWLKRARALLPNGNKQSPPPAPTAHGQSEPVPASPSNGSPMRKLPAAVTSGKETDKNCNLWKN